MPLLYRIEEWKRKQGRSKCDCINPIYASSFDKWMDICFPLYAFVLWMHNCLLDWIILNSMIFGRFCLWCLWMQVRFVERRGSSWNEDKSSIRDHLAKENRLASPPVIRSYFYSWDQVGKIESLFIHLFRVFEEGNSGRLNSLRRIKTQLNTRAQGSNYHLRTKNWS